MESNVTLQDVYKLLETLINSVPTLTEYNELRNSIVNIESTQHRTIKDIEEMKDSLFDPVSGLIVKVNKNSGSIRDIAKQCNQMEKTHQEVRDLAKWKSNTVKIMWVLVTAFIGLLLKNIFTMPQSN